MEKELTEVFNLLRTSKKGVNARIKNGNDTLLIWAASWGYTDIALALIDAEAKLDKQNDAGNTALIRCACEGRLEIAQALIAKNAGVNIPNKQNYTALLLAKRRGNTDIYNALIRANANTSVKTVDGRTLENIGCNPKIPLQRHRDPVLEEKILAEIKKLTPNLT